MMISLIDIIGKIVLDPGGIELGVVDDVEISFPRHNTYLRVKGEKLRDVRGRLEEFIPINEVDRIGDVIHLYKDFKALGEVIKKVEMSSKETYIASRLMGMTVLSLDSEEIGRIADLLVTKDKWKLFYVVEGPKVKGLRGNLRETLPFYEVDSIGECVKIDLAYGDLAKKIRYY
jgi:sporulation protein YlmC with PRC-barrel domain